MNSAADHYRLWLSNYRRHLPAARSLLAFCLLPLTGCSLLPAFSERTAVITEDFPPPIEAKIVISDNAIYQNNRAGIRIRGNTPMRVEGCTIYQNGATGVNIKMASKSVVNNCNISMNGTSGIAVRNANQVQISNNRIHQNTYGGVSILVNDDGSPRFTRMVLEKNDIFRNYRAGIHMQSNTAAPSIFSLSNNIIYRNERSGVRIEDNVHMTAFNNEIFRNKTAGISAYSNDDIPPMFDAFQNKIYANHGAGFFIHGGISGRIGLSNNLIYNNLNAGIALGLWDSPGEEKLDVEIFHNTIVSNGNIKEGAGVRNDSDGNVSIINNIIAYNFKTGIMTTGCSGYNYNLLFANGNTSKPPDKQDGAAAFLQERTQYAGCDGRRWGDILEVPQFTNPDSYDFSLLEESPAINAATEIETPYFKDIGPKNLGFIPSLIPERLLNDKR